MERIMVARVSDIPALRSRTVKVAGTEIAVFKLSSGELHAIENRCPHKNGKLSEGIVCDHHVFLSPARLEDQYEGRFGAGSR